MSHHKPLILLTILTLSLLPACITPQPTTTTTGTSTSTPPITGTTGLPGIQVVAVALDRTQTQNPGGPLVIMELKNISQEAIVSLDVKLYQPNTPFASSWTFDFGISRETLLAPGITRGLRQTLINGGWGIGVSYFVTVAGAYANGTTFSFRWTPPNDGDFGQVTPPPTTPVNQGSESQALAVAIATIPSLALAKANVIPSIDHGAYWSIRVEFAAPITNQELMWVAGPEVILENIGFLPKDTFRTLLIEVDKQTSQIILRRASDNVFLGPIGTSPRNIQALAVISVLDMTPALSLSGPVIEITLRSISSESIISSTAVLSEPNTYMRDFRYDFGISASSPLAPDQIMSANRPLIGGSWGTGVPCYLTISGTLQNGTVFYFRWDPPVA